MEHGQPTQYCPAGVGQVVHSCQTHVFGDAVIPQKLRSLRNVRARQATADFIGQSPKRQCLVGACVDSSEAAIAEMLLGLSNSPRGSSPRESDASTEEEEFISNTSNKRRSAATSPSKANRPHSLNLDKLRSQEMDEDFELDSPLSSQQQSKAAKASKKLPGRCKCGKRVSASHPPCKSELMILCERFCSRFGHLSADGSPTRIHLNECAVALGVPRRRLYDITIVYEAVEVVKRTGKLAYVWRGLDHLPLLVEQLKQEEATGVPVADRKGNSLLPAQNDRQTTHSLWTLSRKFIRLLLTTKGPIQLTDAAEHLIGEQSSAKRQQTQVTVERRLYDIGSILATLNLIHRTYVEGKRQPAFSWNWEWTQERAFPTAWSPKTAAEVEGEPCAPAANRTLAESDSVKLRVSVAGGCAGSAAGFGGAAANPELQGFAGGVPLSLGLSHAWSMPMNFPSPTSNLSAASSVPLPSSRAGSSQVCHAIPGIPVRGQLLQTELPPYAPLVLAAPPQLQCGHAAVGGYPFSMAGARPQA